MKTRIVERLDAIVLLGAEDITLIAAGSLSMRPTKQHRHGETRTCY